MMKTFRFMDFPVYANAKAFYGEILKLTEGLKDFALKSQIRRAALSIILNIAEGSAKSSDKEFARFLEISIGSANEVFACLDVMRSNGSISHDDFNRVSSMCEEIAKQLGGFIKKLKNLG